MMNNATNNNGESMVKAESYEGLKLGFKISSKDWPSILFYRTKGEALKAGHKASHLFKIHNRFECGWGVCRSEFPLLHGRDSYEFKTQH